VPSKASTNRLIHEASPYLLQHAHNPVDWFPWGEEAFQLARKQDKPIFLSIGYSACHWCHVMERESFEDDEIARVLNENFINIKVDREEHPTVDEIFMRAVQLMTRNGGWPLSVFLTPDLRPFFGGTYFPPRDQYGRVGFLSLITGLARMWRERRHELLRNADSVTEYLREMSLFSAEAQELSPAVLTTGVEQIGSTFDSLHGGFGTSPKFPSAPLLRFLLHHGQVEETYSSETVSGCLQMLEITLQQMAAGGIFDHLGGGFHRYSVDEAWHVPHFEKMLYDNALLAELYAEAYAVRRNHLYQQIARRTFDYVLRDMQSPEGAFYASEDADSQGKEGVFYLWTHDEIMSALGDEDGHLFCTYYDVHKNGNFLSHEPYHENLNVLHVPAPMEEVAARLSISLQELAQRLETARERLLLLRSSRQRPHRDEKILLSWNALMIRALSGGYFYLGENRYKDAALRAAEFVQHHMRSPQGELWHSYYGGKPGKAAGFEDYVFWADALMSLYELDFDITRLSEVERLCQTMRKRFWDAEGGGFFSEDGATPYLPARVKPVYDVAEPSPNATAARVFHRMYLYTGNQELLGIAERTVRLLYPIAEELPLAMPTALLAISNLCYPPPEVVIAGRLRSPDTEDLLNSLKHNAPLDTLVGIVDPFQKHAEYETMELFRDKKAMANKATAYLCKNFACSAPIGSAEELAQALHEPRTLQKG